MNERPESSTSRARIDAVSREAVYSAFFLGVAMGALLAFALAAIALP